MNAKALGEQVGQHLLELQTIRQRLDGQPPLPHFRLLQAKLDIKISHLATAADRLHSANSSPAALQQLSAHLGQTYAQAVKEAHRLLQLKTETGGGSRLRSRLAFLSGMEQQMEEGWAPKEPPRLLRRIDEHTSVIAEHVDQGRLRSLAKECLQKEFLAIRMVAYRMYQRHILHAHPQAAQSLQTLSAEQQALAEQAQEMSDLNRELLGEEKRL
jgi:hypothetical protein